MILIKPLQLTLSAFGSYGAVEKIDFTRIDHGLFLISGDTGSGKTTIFDAIVYALYDRTSGGARDGKMMRSQYAAPTQETFVRLTFSCGGDIYTVRRSPAYERPLKRKSKDGSPKMRTVSPSVELTMPDGTLFPEKKRETDLKIQELVGMDADQFTQIALIAQGDFIRLLHATSRDRQQIFSRIFRTRVFQAVQEALREREREANHALEENSSRYREVLDRVSVLRSEQLSRWEEAVRSLNEVFIQSELKALTEESRCTLKQTRRLRSEAQERLQTLRTRLSRANENNRRLSEAKRAREDFAALENRQSEQAQREERLDLAKKAERVSYSEKDYEEAKRSIAQASDALAALQTERSVQEVQLEAAVRRHKCAQEAFEKASPERAAGISRLQKSLPEYERLLQLQKEQENAEKTLQKTKTLLDQQTAVLKRILQQQETARETQKRFSHSTQTLARLKQEEERLLQRESVLSDLAQNYCSQIDTLTQNVQTAEARYKQADKNYYECSQTYERLSKQFLDAQAGILASKLSDGVPCPVCGSLHHPNKKQLSSQAPTQGDVEKAKEETQQADSARREASLLCEKARHCWKYTIDLIEREGKNLLGASFSMECHAAGCALIRQSLRDCQQQQRELLRQKEEASRQDKAYREAGLQIEALQKEEIACRDRKESLLSLLSSDQQRLAECRTRQKEVQKTLSFSSAKEANSELLRLQKEERSEKEQLDSIQRDCDKLHRSLHQKKGEEAQSRRHLEELCSREKRCLSHYQQELALHGFSGEAHYKTCLLSRAEIRQLEEEIRDFSNRFQEAFNRLSLLSEQTKDLVYQNTEQLEADAAQTEQACSQMEREENDLYHICKNNDRILEESNQLAQKRQTLLHDFQIVSTLSRAANGKGAVKVDLETYIQRYYFQEIVKAANRRFYRFSGGQFLLRCKDILSPSGNQATGLDLNVYSVLHNQERDVKTLSGGESFMAALSMALGLADIIQNASGSVHLEMMFIDEGFGSLDETSLQEAIQILRQLAGDQRLVAIISHVVQLGEEIDRKLVVTKGKSGSCVSWEGDAL